MAQAVDPAIDLHRIERWIRAVDEYERVHVKVVSKRLAKGSKEQIVLTPYVPYLKMQMDEIGRAESELGLTPLARLRLGIAYGEARMTALELNKMLDEVAEPVKLEFALDDGE